jgi:plastocyanin
MSLVRWVPLAVLLVAAACSSSTGYGGTPPPPPGPPPPPPPPGPTLGVTVNNNSFSPASGSVTSGGTVTWTWAAGASTHNVTFDDGQGNSVNQSTGSHPRTFPSVTSSTTFPYRCTLHPGMSGQITVVP